MKDLPLGNQGFSEIINNNLLYVDKTEYIYNLYNSTKAHYFLSRPRRFGKSLLLDTMGELFSGNRELFKDLWIGASDYAFPKYPVLDLDLSMDANNREDLRTHLLGLLREKAEAFNLDIGGTSPGIYLGDLVTAISRKFDSQIVVLVDEYDYPVVTNLHDVELARSNVQELHHLFASLKKKDVMKSTRFSFFTGISRYVLTAMESGPNHINDISLLRDYAGICGFTIKEFDSVFADRMESTLASLQESGRMMSCENIDNLRNKILIWYDGYNWDGQSVVLDDDKLFLDKKIVYNDVIRVLNPYSIIHFFDEKQFKNFWILTGRSIHLTTQIRLKAKEYISPKLDSYLLDDLEVSNLENIPVAPVLFQSGYLTLDKVSLVLKLDTETNTLQEHNEYFFRYPNYEVRSSYTADYIKSKGRDRDGAQGEVSRPGGRQFEKGFRWRNPNRQREGEDRVQPQERPPGPEERRVPLLLDHARPARGVADRSGPVR